MTDSNVTTPTADYFSAAPTLRDQALFLSTAADSNRCRSNLHTTISQAPSIRGSITQLLEQRLNLHSQNAHLNVQVGDQTQRIELEEACAFLARHVDLDHQDLSALSVTLPVGHALAEASLQDFIAHLQALDTATFVTEQWDRYWTARQPDTAVSRRDHALQQYYDHLHCACELAYAQGQLSLAQLQPLRTALANHDGAPGVGSPVAIETLNLTATPEGVRRLPGALLFTVPGPTPSAQLLYLPGHVPALSVFPERSALEQYLIQNRIQLWPGDTRISAQDQLIYGAQPSIREAFVQLVGVLRRNRLSCLEHAPGSQLAVQGAQALAASDSFDALRRERFLLAPAPALPPEALNDDAKPGLFGQLYANLDLDTRRASIKQQREAFNALIGSDERKQADHPAMTRLGTAIARLHEQQALARTAANALLAATTPGELIELASRRSQDYEALLAARLQGLKAEAQIQHALRQLDDDEYAAIVQIADSPNAVDRLDDDIVAATLALSLPDSAAPRTQTLEAVLLITRKAALADPGSAQSLLLYWPGEGGGLQRFASRRELASQLFKLEADDAVTLALTPLRDHALAHGLRAQLQQCETAAMALLARSTQHTGAEGIDALPNDGTVATVQGESLEQALARLRQQHLPLLLVPNHDARETAYAHLLELDHSSVLHQHLPGWLSTLPLQDRHHLKALIQQYVPDLRQAQVLLERELIDRDRFVRARIAERIATDTGLQGAYQISFDLPESVTFVRDIVAGSGTPGTPVKLIPKPSDKRVQISLEYLALQNVDDAMRLRFDYMTPLVSGGTAEGRSQLQALLTFAYVQAVVSTLDLAEAYTGQIREVFVGKPQAPTFHNAYCREQLLKPVRSMLKMQSIYGRHRHLLDTPAQRVFELAISAPAATQEGALRVVIHRARMQTDERVNAGNGTELSGICFIEERNSGQTLLYLADDPRGQCVSYHASLDDARKALFTLTLDDGLAHYLADRALLGDDAVHLARLRQAHLAHHDGLIEVGDVASAADASRADGSLADFLLDAQCERLIEHHRSSSRSNAALQVQRDDEKREVVFHFIKMGVGMVPFVGSLVGLYDGVQALSLMIAAISRKDTLETLVQFESVMLCFIDAAMDLVPGAGIASVRGATRFRQMRRLSDHPGSLRVNARQAAGPGSLSHRFGGYEYPMGIDLSGLTPANHGLYRNVYRHADGDFILQDGRVFAVELHDSPATWRLKGNRAKTYQQPIALDEAGQWNTHGALYGTLVNGGLAGGGGVLGHIADGLEPMWPAPIRNYLPTWLTDRFEHRRAALGAANDNRIRAMEVSRLTLTDLEGRVNRAVVADRAALHEQFNRESRRLLAQSKELVPKLEQAIEMMTGTSLTKTKASLSAACATIAERTRHEARIIQHNLSARYAQLDDLRAQSAAIAISIETMADHAALWQQRKLIRVGMIEDMLKIEAHLGELAQWEPRVTVARHRSIVVTEGNTLRRHFSRGAVLEYKIGQYLEAINRYEFIELDWFTLINDMKPQRNAVERAIDTQMSLAEVMPRPSKAVRRTVLEHCIATYSQYRTSLRVWIASHPTYFDMAHVEPLLACLREAVDLARAGIARLPEPHTPLAPRPVHPSAQRRLFEVQDVGWVSGIVEQPGTVRQRITVTGANGEPQVLIVEADGRARLEHRVPAAPLIDIGALRAQAQRQLDALPAFTRTVESYARRNTLPVELQEMLDIKANDLSAKALQIEHLVPDDPIVGQLRGKASELRAKGVAMRIEQCFASKTPTEGYVDYLASQGQIDIQPLGERVELARHSDQRKDFLQEYVVRDLRTPAATPLWYAHFHFDSAVAGFEQFIKAHLKVPEQRYLGMKWQGEQQGAGNEVVAIWRGDIGRPLATRHFAGL